MTERVAKPSFIKTPDGELFQRLRKEVNATVRELEPRRKGDIVLKAILFPLLYLMAYISAMHWRQDTLYILHVLFFDGCFTCS